MRTAITLSRWIGLVSCLSYVGARNLFPSEDASIGTGIFFLPFALLAGLMFVVERVAGARGPRLGAYTWAWSVLLLCWGVSTATASYRHPAMIMTWEWLAVACVCLYARQVAATMGPQVFAIFVVALGLSHASIAFHQSTVTLPELRKAWESNDPAMKESMRSIGVEEGTALETSFRHRLYSQEPYGATGHPNSLAGFLLLSLPLSISWVKSALKQQQASFLSIAILLLNVLAQLTVLIMSKSRSAWLALFVMVILWWWLGRRSILTWRPMLIVVGLGAIVSSLVVVMVSQRLLDVLVLTESMKSLSYRAEWWQATVAIISDHPLWGVGAGSFRDYYLSNKLPFSSEEISDPHNWMLELWATGGLGVLLAYIVCFIVGVQAVFANRWDERLPTSPFVPGWRKILLAGGIGAGLFLIVFETGMDSFLRVTQYPEAWVWMLSLAAILIACRNNLFWVDTDLRLAILVGFLGLHVHELAAGGVSFMALTSAAWMLLGSASHEPLDPYPPRFVTSAVLAGLASALVLLFVFGQLVPAVQRDRIDLEIRRIEHQMAEEQKSIQGTAVARENWESLSRQAAAWVSASRRYAEVSPGDHEGWERLAVAQTFRMRLAARYAQDEEREAYRLAVRAWEESIAIAPQRFESHRQLAKLYLEAAASGLDPEAMRSAWDSLREVQIRYPHSAVLRWEMGDVLSKMNRKEDARREFARALELDKTPHEDKRLSVNQRRIAERYVIEGSPARQER